MGSGSFCVLKSVYRATLEEAQYQPLHGLKGKAHEEAHRYNRGGCVGGGILCAWIEGVVPALICVMLRR
jgi:hypothetical protein